MNALKFWKKSVSAKAVEVRLPADTKQPQSPAAAQQSFDKVIATYAPALEKLAK